MPHPHLFMGLLVLYFPPSLPYLPITNTISVHNDPLRQMTIDLMVIHQSIGHTHLEVVRHLLPSVLELALGVVPTAGRQVGDTVQEYHVWREEVRKKVNMVVSNKKVVLSLHKTVKTLNHPFCSPLSSSHTHPPTHPQTHTHTHTWSGWC